MFKKIHPDIGDNEVETICRILLLLVPLDDITGLALFEDETKIELGAKKIPLVCKLAGYFAERTDKKSAGYIRDLGEILRANDSIQHFPALGIKPPSKTNPLWNAHAKLSVYSLYPLFARDLQIGLVAEWNRSGWGAKKIPTVISKISPVRRILPDLPEKEIRDFIELGDDQGAGELIKQTANKLFYKSGNFWEPLPSETRELYFRCFCMVTNRETWLDYPRRNTGGGVLDRIEIVVLLTRKTIYLKAAARLMEY
jgi:hypothetical protein